VTRSLRPRSVEHVKEVDPVKKFSLIVTPVMSFSDAAVILAGPTSGAVPST
jgi:hypothetical protein